ncbi:hypothetical protein NQ314_000767 [Rhamnusium bicolor]|uniref:RRM domain-containing protein n=1 Tax=Rhamnusium bicolor TaxID=1586634 RepID=A0AAV8ZVQ1_9CUCU|nr:hypothetical protein NQ314_000767 [Rhamnusium bicolor]
MKSKSLQNIKNEDIEGKVVGLKTKKHKKISRKKGKKRKLETSLSGTSDFVDSDEEIPSKKEKLTDYKQNAERRVKKKINEKKKIQSPEELSRTIFVGNIPITIDKKKIQRYFKKYGLIDSIRIRGIPVADPKTSKKVAAIKKEFNPNRSNVYCYIRFQNKEDALKAEAENGAIFKEHHLRVHSCDSEDKPDETKAIFVGNLSFDAVEDELWNLFEQCGPISYVRIIRDGYTGMGKGFAYVNFKDSDAVQLALEMENVKLKDRELRISLSNLNMAKKNKKFNKNKKDKETSERQNGKTNRVNGEFQGTKFSDNKKVSLVGVAQT